MNNSLILGFLRDITENNNREWFQRHREQYDEARKDFESGVEKMIACIAGFDPSIAHITVRDATYRFYRDTRFSPDKSPYKRHFGAYVAAHGKKSLHGGYYIHLQPEECLIACGTYWLPTNILTSCRNEIMARESEWLDIVESPEFMRLYGNDGSATWGDERGFGMSRLKTVPKGFPKDYPHLHYLQMKDYCCWHAVPNDFFSGDDWLAQIEHDFKVAKPMLDFINSVVDDYE